MTVAFYDREKVIEVMGNATCQPTNSLHLLRLMKLLFKGFCLLLCLHTLGEKLCIGDGPRNLITNPFGKSQIPFCVGI